MLLERFMPKHIARMEAEIVKRCGIVEELEELIECDITDAEVADVQSEIDMNDEIIFNVRHQMLCLIERN